MFQLRARAGVLLFSCWLLMLSEHKVDTYLIVYFLLFHIQLNSLISFMFTVWCPYGGIIFPQISSSLWNKLLPFDKRVCYIAAQILQRKAIKNFKTTTNEQTNKQEQKQKTKNALIYTVQGFLNVIIPGSPTLANNSATLHQDLSSGPINSVVLQGEPWWNWSLVCHGDLMKRGWTLLSLPFPQEENRPDNSKLI